MHHIRDEVLDEAKNLISTDREQDYGSPRESFERIARLWTHYFGTHFAPADVAAMLALVKISRIARDPAKQDSWVDLAGYAALGAEVSDQ